MVEGVVGGLVVGVVFRTVWARLSIWGLWGIRPPSAVVDGVVGGLVVHVVFRTAWWSAGLRGVSYGVSQLLAWSLGAHFSWFLLMGVDCVGGPGPLGRAPGIVGGGR
ncbi:hypothetical protein Ssi02_17440 [Sinosporangium siamense]|uniref:Uncharacterized protein n=1 Tax=Sinosporangium siamense TaxID=1367973 RepID=A0A919RCS0_9ACTN|nr:hypothetical protein Ssi02_17440 [Sinosporangium siamense]